MGRRFPDDPRSWHLVDQEYLHRRPPWLILRRDHLRLPNGQEIRDYFVQEFPPWVNVVAVTPDDRVVLIRQFRPGIGDVHFEIPAGSVEAHESATLDFEAAARRELLEETGYGNGRWSPLLTLSANSALQTNLSYSFLAEDVECLAAPAPEATEDIRVHLVAMDALPDLIQRGDLIQALHAAPLLHYLLQRRGRTI
jgi:8-oxo-dGDP phosphatase